jgi:hypothetical protein
LRAYNELYQINDYLVSHPNEIKYPLKDLYGHKFMAKESQLIFSSPSIGNFHWPTFRPSGQISKKWLFQHPTISYINLTLPQRVLVDKIIKSRQNRFRFILCTIMFGAISHLIHPSFEWISMPFFFLSGHYTGLNYQYKIDKNEFSKVFQHPNQQLVYVDYCGNIVFSHSAFKYRQRYQIGTLTDN